MKLIELLDAVSGSRYPPLRDGVCNINSDVAVKTEEQVIRTHSCCMALTVVVCKLGKREETCPHSLVFSHIGPQVVFDNSVQGLALAICLRVIGSQQTSLYHLDFAHFTPEV